MNVRTYEGVQWFEDGDHHVQHWRTSIPGTSLSVVRWQDLPFRQGWFAQVEIWIDAFGGFWYPISINKKGQSEDTSFILPWDYLHGMSVAQITRDVNVLRGQVAAQVVRQ